MTADDRSEEPIRSGESTSFGLLADAKLVRPAAWERLVRLYAPLVASWCRRGGIAAQDVGDVVQDVFMAVSRNLDRFQKVRSTDSFRGWLATITRNKIHDHFRRRAAEPAATGGTEATQRLQQILDPHPRGTPQPITDSDGADDLLLNDLLRRALESIRGEFHARTWQAFWEVVVEGRVAADVAADLDMQPGAVRVAKSRVLLRLRKELGEAPRTW